VEGVVVVAGLGVLVGKVGNLRQVDGHLRRRGGRVGERDDPGLTLLARVNVPAGIRDAPVVGRDALVFQQFEVERAHRTEARALARIASGICPQSNTE